MKNVIATALATGAMMMAVAGPADATLVLGTNLVANGNAEAGSPGASIPSFTGNIGGMVVVPYGASGFPTSTDPGPSNRGSQFFAGGERSRFSYIQQTVSVANGAAAIDAGIIAFTLSAFLGGFGAQDDYTTFQVYFRDAANAPLGKSTLYGPDAAGRGNQTGLLARSATGSIPVGTRSLLFELDATRLDGTSNEGYADNLSFVATTGLLPRSPTPIGGYADTLSLFAANSPGTPVPEPSSVALLSLGALALGACRRRVRGTKAD